MNVGIYWYGLQWCIFWLYLIANSEAQNPIHCDVKNHSSSGHLSWDWQPASLSLVCNGKYNELHCCAQHYTHILWYEKIDGAWVHFNSSFVRFVDENTHNQTVIFKAAGLDDAHEYKCVVSNKTTKEKLEQIVQMHVLSCKDWEQPPDIIEPKAAEGTTVIKVETEHSQRLSCVAFFGMLPATGQSEGYMIWQKFDGDNFQDFHNNKSTRIYVEETNRIAGNGLESVLHIRDVRNDDYGNYKCSAYNSYDPFPHRNFTLEYKLPAWVKPAATIVVSVVATLIVIVCIAALLWYNRLKIRMCARRVCRLPRHSGIDRAEVVAPLVTPTPSTGHVQEDGVWQSASDDAHPNIEAKFETPIKIQAVTTQGYPCKNHWVKTYFMTFSSDLEKWFCFDNDGEVTNFEQCNHRLTCAGNTDATTKATQFFPQHVIAHYVRLHPVTWEHPEQGVAVRWDVIGCPAKRDVAMLYPDEADRDDDDFKFGRYLQKKLEENTTWVFCPDSIPCGTRTKDQLLKGVENSRKVVIVMSADILRNMYSIPSDEHENTTPAQPMRRNRRPKQRGSRGSQAPLLLDGSRLSSNTSGTLSGHFRTETTSFSSASGSENPQPDPRKPSGNERVTSTISETKPLLIGSTSESGACGVGDPRDKRPIDNIDECVEDVFSPEEGCPEYCRVFRRYISFLCDLSDEHLAKVVIVLRGKITEADWAELHQHATESEVFNTESLQSLQQTLNSRISKTITWTHSDHGFPPTDQTCRPVEQFWRKIYLALPYPSDKKVFDTRNEITDLKQAERQNIHEATNQHQSVEEEPKMESYDSGAVGESMESSQESTLNSGVSIHLIYSRAERQNQILDPLELSEESVSVDIEPQNGAAPNPKDDSAFVMENEETPIVVDMNSNEANTDNSLAPTIPTNVHEAANQQQCAEGGPSIQSYDSGAVGESMESSQESTLNSGVPIHSSSYSSGHDSSEYTPPSSNSTGTKVPTISSSCPIPTINTHIMTPNGRNTETQNGDALVGSHESGYSTTPTSPYADQNGELGLNKGEDTAIQIQ